MGSESFVYIFENRCMYKHDRGDTASRLEKVSFAKTSRTSDTRVKLIHVRFVVGQVGR